MAAQELIVTDFLVLRKIPYQDSRTIFSGISPEYGKLSVMMRTRTSATNRDYRNGDIFQLWNLTYRPTNAEIVTVSRWEITQDFTSLATNYHTFEAACWLSKFILTNTVAGAPMPQLYRAIYVAMLRVQENRIPPTAILTGVGLTFLRVGGWMTPQTMPATEASQCELLLRMANGGDTPALTIENWQELWQWTLQHLAAADCDIQI